MVQHISVTASSDAAPETVFALLRDPATWTAWSSMDSVELDTPADGDPLGVGSIRALTRGRVHGRDQVVELVANRRFSYLHLVGLPVRDYRADVDLEPDGGGTRITWSATFRPRYPGTGWFWRAGIQRMLREMTAGLASYAARSVRR